MFFKSKVTEKIKLHLVIWKLPQQLNIVIPFSCRMNSFKFNNCQNFLKTIFIKTENDRLIRNFSVVKNYNIPCQNLLLKSCTCTPHEAVLFSV